MVDLAALATAVRAILPAGLALGVADPQAQPTPFWPGEEITALPRRVAEYCAGRRAARDAMTALGLTAKPVPMGPDRAPIWPQGLTGSISHSGSACFAAVGTTADWRGLGIDLEPEVPLEPELWPTILRPEEIEVLADATQAMALFVIKEAVYKAQYPITKLLFGFEVLTVRLDRDRFEARFTETQGAFAKGDIVAGKWQNCQGHIVAFAGLTR